jgi:hypothetical protein
MRLADARYRSPLTLPVPPVLRRFKTSTFMPHHWVFLDRDCALKALQPRQPMPGIGWRPYNWEEAAMRERLEVEGA